MNKNHPITGIISSVLTLAPPIGFLGIFLLSLGPTFAFGSACSVFLSMALFVAPIVGLIFGIIGLFNKRKRRLLPIVGTTVNVGWIVVLVWGYFAVMQIVYR